MPRKEVDFHQFITPRNYHYNPADGLWYDVDTEQPPVPTTSSTLDNNFTVEFFNGNYVWDEPNTYDEFAQDAQEALQGSVGGPGFTFTFTNQKKEKVCCYFQSWLLWDFDDFIQHVKDGKFAAIYIEPYSDLKLLVWPLENNKLRVIIQCQRYDGAFYTGTITTIDPKTQRGYKFLESVLDVIADKDQFVTALENAITQAKDDLRTMIVNYVINDKNLSATNILGASDKILYLAGKMGLEPMIKD
jgi:hypothetical protein